jgi:hypothetical protein
MSFREASSRAKEAKKTRVGVVIVPARSSRATFLVLFVESTGSLSRDRNSFDGSLESRLLGLERKGCRGRLAQEIDRLSILMNGGVAPIGPQQY